MHFVTQNVGYISYPVSVDWIVKRGLSEEVAAELRHEKAVMGRSEELQVQRSRGENGPGMFKGEKEASVAGCNEQGSVFKRL